MIVLKFLFKLIKVMNSETSTRALALAFTLGMFLGLVPWLTLQWGAVLLLVLFFRVNLTSTLVTFLIFRLIAIPLQGPLDAAGCALLQHESLTGLWTFLYNTPVLDALRSNHAVVLGATCLALLLLAPVFFLSRFVVGRYRKHVLKWILRSRVVTFFKGLRIYQLYRRITSPLTA
ncbi:MAG: TIGR03546 family protein [Planctomycetota bacterium]|jgi:uncharacterized protein (TIGR03546 family)